MSTKPIPRLPDGSVDPSGDLGSHFDDVMDVLHSTLAAPTHALDAEAQERQVRAERAFWDALVVDVRGALGHHGFLVAGHGAPPEAEDDFDREVTLIDGRGAEYTVLIPKSAARNSFGLLDESVRPELLKLIHGAVLHAAQLKYGSRRLRKSPTKH